MVFSSMTHSLHTRTRADVIFCFVSKRKRKVLTLFSFVFLLACGKGLSNSLPVVMICVIKTNLMDNLSSVYFVIQPLHVSGIFVADHQEEYCIYTTIGTCCAFQLNVCWPACWPTDIQLKSTTRTNCCIYTVFLLMIGYKYARNM